MKMRKKVMKKENLPETTRRKIVMILKKLKMLTNPPRSSPPSECQGWQESQTFQPGGRRKCGFL